MGFSFSSHWVRTNEMIYELLFETVTIIFKISLGMSNLPILIIVFLLNALGKFE